MGCGPSSVKTGGEPNNVRSQTSVPPGPSPPHYPNDPVYIPAPPDPIAPPDPFAPKPIPPKPAPYRPPAPPPAAVPPPAEQRAVPRDFNPQQGPAVPQKKPRAPKTPPKESSSQPSASHQRSSQQGSSHQRRSSQQGSSHQRTSQQGSSHQRSSQQGSSQQRSPQELNSQQDYTPRTPKERSGEERQERHSSHQKKTRSPNGKRRKKKSGEGRSRDRDGRDQPSTASVSYSAAQSTGAPVAKHREKRKSATAAEPPLYQPPPAVSSLVKTAPPPVVVEPVVKQAPPPVAVEPVVKQEEPRKPSPPAKRESSPHKPPPEPQAKTVVVVDSPTKKVHVKRREKGYADYDKVLSNKGMKMSDIPQPDSKSGKPFSELYSLKGVLGTGAFSTVREGSHVSNPKVTYAVKCVNRPKLSEEDEAALLDEVSILKEMNHIHIIRLYDFFTTPSTYYLVMERMSGGELFDRIVAKAYYNEKEARDTCKILLEAVGYCHDNYVAHRDLKPENLLLRSEEDDSAVKIADFGFAKKVREPRSLTTQCGTPGYVAPEILEGVPYDTKSDMWSVGVILYILLGGYPPFIENNQRDLFRKIRKGEYEFHDEYWSQVSSGAKDLISSLLTVDPDVRLDAQQALDNAWIRQDDESLEKKDLGVNLQEFKKFNAKRKFRAAVSSVLAVNKLQSLGKDFLGSLQDSG